MIKAPWPRQDVSACESDSNVVSLTVKASTAATPMCGARRGPNETVLTAQMCVSGMDAATAPLVRGWPSGSLHFIFTLFFVFFWG